MKKLLLITAALCCMVSAVAQKSQANVSLREKVKMVEQLNRNAGSYTEKLDSITQISSKVRAITKYYYDDRFNVTKIEEEENNLVKEYGYDSLNRVTFYKITRSYYEEVYTSMCKYVYDEQGKVSEEILSVLEDGEWNDVAKVIYEYDNNNNVLVATQIDINGENQTKREYLYQGDLLLEEIEYDWNYNRWVEEEKIQYSYDDRNDRIEMIDFYYLIDDWGYNERYTMDYDNNHNCTRCQKYFYDYESQEWWADFMSEFVYYYDLSISSSSIAGLSSFQNVFNKRLYYTEPLLIVGSQPGEEHFRITQYHYSSITSVNESTENQLIIWPNPVEDVLHLETKDLQQVEVFSLDGKRVMTDGSGLENINVTMLSNGCYLLKATLKDGKTMMQRFVKQ